MPIRRLAIVLAVTTSLIAPSVAAAQPAPVRVKAELDCVTGGGADVRLSVRNLSRRTLAIEPDFHLTLYAVRAPGRQPVTVAFVFPVPDFAKLPPHGSSTFPVPMGTGEGGEPGLDLTARRLILESEVWFKGRNQPVRRFFSFPGC